MPSELPSLYVEPRRFAFERDEHKRLRAMLEAQTDHTEAETVHERNELLMDVQGVLPNGFRYTETAYKQVCMLLCTGLHYYTKDISGMRRRSGDVGSEYDLGAAFAAYNSVVKLRFESRLAGNYRLLRHLKDKRVEGVLGPRYVLVPNSEILEHADDAAADCEGRLVFHEATLAGRRLELRYGASSPFLTLEDSLGSDNYYTGLYFSNSEIGGETTFRAATLLYRERYKSASMSPFLGGRHVHVGRNFMDRLSAVFSEASHAALEAKFVKQRLGELAKKPLDLDVGDENERRERREALSVQLRRYALSAKLADNIVSLVRAGPALVAPSMTVDKPGPSTQFDLYTALTNYGRKLYSAARTQVEQAAYGLITGKTKIMRGT